MTTEMTSSETLGTEELSMKLIVHGENVLNANQTIDFSDLQEKNMLFHFFLAKRSCATGKTPSQLSLNCLVVRIISAILLLQETDCEFNNE